MGIIIEKESEEVYTDRNYQNEIIEYHLPLVNQSIAYKWEGAISGSNSKNSQTEL